MHTKWWSARSSRLAISETLCNIADITTTSDIAPFVVPFFSLAASQGEQKNQHRQQQSVRQCSNDLDELYADAEQAHARLRSLFARKWRVWKEVASLDGEKTVLSVSVQGETEEWVDKIVDPGFSPSVSVENAVVDTHLLRHTFALVCNNLTICVKRTEEQSLRHAEDCH